jgi:hypothetical protein
MVLCSSENVEVTARDCQDYGTDIPAGTYPIRIRDSVVEVYCSADGSTVIQSRGQFGYPKDFFYNKTWKDYQKGFGDPGNRRSEGHS